MPGRFRRSPGSFEVLLPGVVDDDRRALDLQRIATATDERGVHTLAEPKEPTVGIGVSVFLMAVGAILTFAVEASADGININTVGIILMVVGAIGLLATLVLLGGGAPWGARRRTVVRDDTVL